MASRQLIPRIALLALFSANAHAAVIEANPSNYQAVVLGLAPGDTLRLAAGTYTQGLSLSGMAGSASRPIVVTGPDDQSAVFTARDCCNTIQLDGTSFLQVMNLTLDGGGHAGPAGVDSRGTSHHITLENLKIVGYNGSPQTAAISTEGRAANWIIRHDTIVGAGTGLHLGNADGSQPFVAGLIEHNVMLDTMGPDMEIIGSPAGVARTIVRYNILSKARAVTADASEEYESYGNYVYPAAASANKSRSVRALAAATPTVTLTASPTTVAAGGTSTLTWSSTGADGCAASGGWTGTKATSGSATVGPIQSATSYQLTCLGAGGNAGAMVQVSVGNVSTPPPTMDPTPTPTPTTPPATGNSGYGGGGGSFDMLTIGFLSLVIGYRRRSRYHRIGHAER
jgi:hypothetical protein